jgi:hypothetical protein
MNTRDILLIRTGSLLPPSPRRYLRAGPLIATLEEGALRSIYLNSCEVLHGIYAAVRDQNWNTIPPHFRSYQVEEHTDSFLVSFVAEHVSAEIDFVWSGRIEGSSSGEITFTLDGQARRAFRKNRIGFCVLHPLELAGTSLEVETPSGTVTGVFPEHISPSQPFKDIVALRYSCSPDEPETKLELRFSGELFEMEDQRNWTDASYKTYCTPLHLPYPVELPAGARVLQSVSLRPLTYRSQQPVQVPRTSAEVSVTVGTQGSGPLPALGFELPLDTTQLSSVALEHLRALRPAYLWVELDLAQAGWENRLVRARDIAALLRTEMELSVLCDDQGQDLMPLFERVVEQQIALARLGCFSRKTHVTTRQMLLSASKRREATKVNVQLGAGSRANFAEFNRAILPLDLADLVTYPINPQVHAFDNCSLVETLPVQAATASNAQRLAPGLPLSVGPVTLKPRFNAVATSRVESEDSKDTLPCIDMRQRSLFGASWTIGSLHSLAPYTRWLTYFQTTGPCGLLEEEFDREMKPPGSFLSLSGAVFPVYHVFADVAEFRQSMVLPVEISESGSVEALALRQQDRVLLLIANLRETQQIVRLHLPQAFHLAGRVLDETTARTAMYEPARFRQNKQTPFQYTSGRLTFALLPYAVMRVEGVYSGGLDN